MSDEPSIPRDRPTQPAPPPPQITIEDIASMVADQLKAFEESIDSKLDKRLATFELRFQSAVQGFQELLVESNGLMREALNHAISRDSEIPNIKDRLAIVEREVSMLKRAAAKSEPVSEEIIQ